MSGKSRLQLSDDAVTLADAEELVAVIVDGDDPRDLFQCEFGMGRFVALQLDGDFLIGAYWRSTAPAYPLPPSTGNASRIAPSNAKRLAFSRPKAKGCGRLQRKRSDGNQSRGV